MQIHSKPQLKPIKSQKHRKKIVIEKCYEVNEKESDDEQQQKRPLKNISKVCKSTQIEDSISVSKSLSLNKTKRKTDSKKLIDSSSVRRTKEKSENKKNRLKLKNLKFKTDSRSFRRKKE